MFAGALVDGADDPGRVSEHVVAAQRREPPARSLRPRLHGTARTAPRRAAAPCSKSAASSTCAATAHGTMAHPRHRTRLPPVFFIGRTPMSLSAPAIRTRYRHRKAPDPVRKLRPDRRVGLLRLRRSGRGCSSFPDTNSLYSPAATRSSATPRSSVTARYGCATTFAPATGVRLCRVRGDDRQEARRRGHDAHADSGRLPPVCAAARTVRQGRGRPRCGDPRRPGRARATSAW